jgi:hypothetical protein
MKINNNGKLAKFAIKQSSELCGGIIIVLSVIFWKH